MNRSARRLSGHEAGGKPELERMDFYDPARRCHRMMHSAHGHGTRKFTWNSAHSVGRCAFGGTIEKNDCTVTPMGNTLAHDANSRLHTPRDGLRTPREHLEVGLNDKKSLYTRREWAVRRLNSHETHGEPELESNARRSITAQLRHSVRHPILRDTTGRLTWNLANAVGLDGYRYSLCPVTQRNNTSRAPKT